MSTFWTSISCHLCPSLCRPTNTFDLSSALTFCALVFRVRPFGTRPASLRPKGWILIRTRSSPSLSDLRGLYRAFGQFYNRGLGLLGKFGFGRNKLFPKNLQNLPNRTFQKVPHLCSFWFSNPCTWVSFRVALLGNVTSDWCWMQLWMELVYKTWCTGRFVNAALGVTGAIGWIPICSCQCSLFQPNLGVYPIKNGYFTKNACTWLETPCSPLPGTAPHLSVGCLWYCSSALLMWMGFNCNPVTAELRTQLWMWLEYRHDVRYYTEQPWCLLVLFHVSDFRTALSLWIFIASPPDLCPLHVIY